MPYNGTGGFDPLPPPTYPAVAGDTIRAAYFNAVIDDIRAGLALTLVRDGQAPITGNVDLTNHKFTNALNATANQEFTTLAQTTAAYIARATAVWQTSADTKERFFFDVNASTYIRGHGASPVLFANAAGSVIGAISSTGVLSTTADAVTAADIPRLGQVQATALSIAQTVLATAAPLSAFQNLQTSTTGLDLNITVTAEALLLRGTVDTIVLSNVNITQSAASALDTGALAANTWYSLWIIYNPTSVVSALLISLSGTAPVLPAGYTSKIRVGWARTDATVNTYPLKMKSWGRDFAYAPAAGSNITGFPLAISGNTGLVQVSLAALIPVTASKVTGYSLLGGANSNAFVQASASGGSGVQGFQVGGGAFCIDYGNFTMVLEARELYFTSGNATANGVYITGWADNL
jgi:hypothetical protein